MTLKIHNYDSFAEEHKVTINGERVASLTCHTLKVFEHKEFVGWEITINGEFKTFVLNTEFSEDLYGEFKMDIDEMSYLHHLNMLNNPILGKGRRNCSKLAKDCIKSYFQSIK